MITLIWNKFDLGLDIYFLEDKHEPLVLRCAGRFANLGAPDADRERLGELLVTSEPLKDPPFFTPQGTIYISGFIP